MTPLELARMIDHTLLKPEATSQQIDRLCDEAIQHQFYSVCANPVFVPQINRRLQGSETVACCVTGFPLGAHSTIIKVDETRRAIDDGATEIDMVVHLGSVLSGEFSRVRDDIAAVAQVVHSTSNRHVLKVILETAVLSELQTIEACRCCREAQADFVKTSTGFHPRGGATPATVRLLKQHCGPMKIKSAGGIRDWATARAMIEAGADRIGCSASVSIMKELSSLPH